jgi:hypothetical protein
MARALFERLRVVFKFGAMILEDQDCSRLCDALEKIRLQKPTSRSEQMTAEHARAICATARKHFGWHSIALAQAFQFGCALSQKDVIGEMVPLSEPGKSDVVIRGQKWLRGLRWEEIDQNLILKHISKKQKLTEIDLKLEPFVLQELQCLVGDEPLIVVNEITKKTTVNRYLLPSSGPVILCDINALPWSTAEFRRKWAKVAKEAGVPNAIKNRHSFRHAAHHS